MGVEGEDPPFVRSGHFEQTVSPLEAKVEDRDGGSGRVGWNAVNENSHGAEVSDWPPRVGPMRVLITGATGYLGTAMREAVPVGVEVIATGFSRGPLSLDVTDQQAVEVAVNHHRPDVVVHLAAVSVTAAAADEPDRAAAVNVAGAQTVAAVTGRSGIRLVAISTDLVFDGTAAPYDENAAPHPINAYGASKLAGEQAITSEHFAPLILRTSVLVGRDRADRYPFTTYVVRQAQAGLKVELFENERRNFFPVTHAAAAIWESAANQVTGVLHIGATESMSRLEFGRRLLEAAGLNERLASSATGPPDRPSDLTLTVDRAQALLATPMPTLDEVMAEMRRDLRLT